MQQTPHNTELCQATLKKMTPSLVTLMSSPPEIQYVVLVNTLLIIQKYPDLLRDDFRVFFCKYNDPIYIKLKKLDVLQCLSDQDNMLLIFSELKE